MSDIYHDYIKNFYVVPFVVFASVSLLFFIFAGAIACITREINIGIGILLCIGVILAILAAIAMVASFREFSRVHNRKLDKDIIDVIERVNPVLDAMENVEKKKEAFECLAEIERLKDKLSLLNEIDGIKTQVQHLSQLHERCKSVDGLEEKIMELSEKIARKVEEKSANSLEEAFNEVIREKANCIDTESNAPTNK